MARRARRQDGEAERRRHVFGGRRKRRHDQGERRAGAITGVVLAGLVPAVGRLVAAIRFTVRAVGFAAGGLPGRVAVARIGARDSVGRSGFELLRRRTVSSSGSPRRGAAGQDSGGQHAAQGGNERGLHGRSLATAECVKQACRIRDDRGSFPSNFPTLLSSDLYTGNKGDTMPLTDAGWLDRRLLHADGGRAA